MGVFLTAEELWELRNSVTAIRSQTWVVVQSQSPVRLFGTPWAAAQQAPLSFTIPPSWLKFMCIESVVLSNHAILCHRHLLLSSQQLCPLHSCSQLQIWSFNSPGCLHLPPPTSPHLFLGLITPTPAVSSVLSSQHPERALYIKNPMMLLVLEIISCYHHFGMY